MAVKPTRGFQISGVPMIDPKGRWYLLHVTGERPLAPMELGLTQAPLADGVFFPRERGRLRRLLVFLCNVVHLAPRA